MAEPSSTMPWNTKAKPTAPRSTPLRRSDHAAALRQRRRLVGERKRAARQHRRGWSRSPATLRTAARRPFRRAAASSRSACGCLRILYQMISAMMRMGVRNTMNTTPRTSAASAGVAVQELVERVVLAIHVHADGDAALVRISRFAGGVAGCFPRRRRPLRGRPRARRQRRLARPPSSPGRARASRPRSSRFPQAVEERAAQAPAGRHRAPFGERRSG